MQIVLYKEIKEDVYILYRLENENWKIKETNHRSATEDFLMKNSLKVFFVKL